MGVTVLVAEEDLNLHKLIHDILEVVFRDIVIDRALSLESLLEKAREDEKRYDLILFDLHFDEQTDAGALQVLRREMPQYDDHIVLLADSTEEIEDNEAAKGLRYILKPFSLDEFSEVIRQVCVP